MTSYTVKAGDTLTKIARAFGITVQDIVQANAIPNPNRINTGVVLTIPNNPDILSEFVPTQKRLPVTIDASTGEPIPEVLITGHRPPVPNQSLAFDLSDWLQPPKLYLGIALVIGAAILLSGGSRRGRRND